VIGRPEELAAVAGVICSKDGPSCSGKPPREELPNSRPSDDGPLDARLTVEGLLPTYPARPSLFCSHLRGGWPSGWGIHAQDDARARAAAGSLCRSGPHAVTAASV
jgi:hypothetical protein